MESDPGENHEQLLAERDAIMRQLELLGSDSDEDDEDDEESNEINVKDEIDIKDISQETDTQTIGTQNHVGCFEIVAKEEIVDENGYTSDTSFSVMKRSDFDEENIDFQLDKNEENSLDGVEFSERETIEQDEDTADGLEQDNSGSSSNNSPSSPILM
uniref:Uncharacterized protein n=1 Tax=Caenorhabditis tropicalis TaxID=1561998 RepID=A0A1I7T8S6_9PELO